MEAISSILRDLFVMFVAAKLAGELFHRLGQPPVIGELLAGAVIGPHALGLIGQPSAALVSQVGAQGAADSLAMTYQVIAQLGVVILLFFVGLETPLADLLQVGLRATVVAVAGVCLPFALGLAAMLAIGAPIGEALFVGAALVATSVGITARVLSDIGQLGSREARIILGAAVIDDVLGLLVLAVVTGVGRDGRLDAPSLLLVAGQAVLFIGAVGFIGSRAARRHAWRVEALQIQNAPFVVAMATCLGLAALAAQFGLAAIIGAFLAGMAFAETRAHFALERTALPVYELLVPFFFVISGSQVDLRLLLAPDVLTLGLAITGLAIVGKVVACGLASAGIGGRGMAIVGVGMVPRGEVGLIIATAGASLALVPPAVFSVVVLMSVLTTVLVPPVLAALFRLPTRAAQAPPADLELEGVLPGM